MDGALLWITSVWGFVKDSLTWDNTNALVISLAGALAGAYAGAVAAQRSSSREKRRETLMGEIRSTNAAISLAFTVCNSALSLKKQHVKRLKESFDLEFAKIGDHEKKLLSGEVDRKTVIHFVADLNSIQMPVFPIDALKSLAFEELVLASRPMAAVVALMQSVTGLEGSLSRRNTIIDDTKRAGRAPGEAMPPHLYFGLSFGGGHVNRDYPDTIQAISSLNDDVIFFSLMLCDDLNEHGKKAAASYRRDFGRKDVPQIRKPDFSKAKTLGLMPNRDLYLDWLSGFKQTPLRSGLRGVIDRIKGRLNYSQQHSSFTNF